MNKLILLISILLVAVKSPRCEAQKYEHLLSVGSVQLEEGFNQGLVFTGPRLDYKFGINWRLQDFTLSYSPVVGLGVPFSHRMYAVSLNIVPVDVVASRKLYVEKKQALKVGLGFKMDYSYQVYPNLQSGHLFWMTEIGLSANLTYHYNWGRRRVGLSARNSLLGLVSKKQCDDPYYYSLKFVDFVRFAHRDLKFSSFNRYNHTEVSVEFTPEVAKMYSYCIGVDYLSAYYGMHFKQLSYMLTWKISL